MNEYKISLIIPCFNEEKTIQQVIDKSRRRVDEIIIINDASTDNTKRILHKNKDIILINNFENLGQEQSIEKGIQNSTGNIIIIMDSDFEHDPDDIQRFIAHLILNKNDLVIGKRKYIPRAGERKLNELFEKKYGITDAMNGFRAFKKDLYKKIGFYYKNDYFGIDFLIESLKNYKVEQIEIKDVKRRDKPRIGDNEIIEEKLQVIINYVEERFKK